MSEFRKKLRRRLAYLPTLFSITLVLFLVGLFGLLLVNANALKQYFRENIQLMIAFRDNVAEADIMRIKEQLSNKPSVKAVAYTSKEEALRSMKEYVGEDLDKLLGDMNPMHNTLSVSFHAGFVKPDSLAIMKAEMEKDPGIMEVSYNQMLLENMDRNVSIIGIVLLSVAAIMTLVSIALIYNTIRLTLYARRFLIKSMQLVGATRGFIRMPFLKRGFLLGFLSGAIACGLLYAGLYFLLQAFPSLTIVQDRFQLAVLFASILGLGIVISTIASFSAINKYLRMKLDDLF